MALPSFATVILFALFFCQRFTAHCQLRASAAKELLPI